jgi:lipoprotein-anchoring transpeptidase ErfK/SrfK
VYKRRIVIIGILIAAAFLLSGSFREVLPESLADPDLGAVSIDRTAGEAGAASALPAVEQIEAAEENRGAAVEGQSSPINDQAVAEAGAGIDKGNLWILVEKAAYRLTVYRDGQPVKSYPAVFGPNPVGPKLVAGDGRTPEGEFKIRELYPHPEWSRFLWLDYPNEDSWRNYTEAMAAGRISSDVGIGGQIGIHGVPAGEDYLIYGRSNWTLGCVALTTADINELYQMVQRGTRVVIVP